MKKAEKRKAPRRPNSIRILGYLLVLQGLMLLAMGIWHFSLSQGPKQLREWLFSLFIRAPAADEMYISFLLFSQEIIAYATEHNLLAALIESAFLLLLTVVALVAAIGFFRVWPNAWTQAMFVQGASLLLGLILYFMGKPIHIFIVMVYAIFMVIYLNYAHIQDFFRKQEREQAEADD